MHSKKNIGRALTNHDGSVIVIALVILIATSALGVTMMNLGSSETQLVTNEKWKEVSFYDSDACSIVTSRFLRHLGELYSKGEGSFIPVGAPKAPGVQYPDTVTSSATANYLHNATSNYLENVDGNMEFVFQTVLGYTPELLAAVADIRPRQSGVVEGTAANQQNAGYSAGIGTGGAGGGGQTNYYIVACEGRELTPPADPGPAAPVVAAPKAQSRTYVMYRRLIGKIPGGL